MFIANKFEEVINLVKQIEERHLAKQNIYITRWSISKKFTMKDFFKKKGVPQKEFLKDLSLLIVKKITNSICGKYVAKMVNFTFMSKVKFPFQKPIFTRNIIKISGEKKNYIFFLHWQNVILQQLALICECPKELNYDVFALVNIFLGEGLVAKACDYWLVKTIETIGQALVKSLIKLLDKYGLMKKIIVYVKDEESNLNAMTWIEICCGL